MLILIAYASWSLIYINMIIYSEYNGIVSNWCIVKSWSWSIFINKSNFAQINCHQSSSHQDLVWLGIRCNVSYYWNLHSKYSCCCCCWWCSCYHYHNHSWIHLFRNWFVSSSKLTSLQIIPDSCMIVLLADQSIIFLTILCGVILGLKGNRPSVWWCWK